MSLLFAEAGALLSSSSQQCTPATFSNVSLYGAEIQSVAASLADAPLPAAVANFWPSRQPGATVRVCNVTITYTHPGWGDTINTFVQLPVGSSSSSSSSSLPEDGSGVDGVGWNGRLLGVGGGGWATGQHADLALPAAKGFATVATDGGHAGVQPVEDWALTGVNINWYLLQDFASVALDDAATLGKGVVAAFYGERPSKSYYSGCSTGGRQGHMLAQRYPEQYDGILASASAFNWDRMLPAEYWPFIAMKEIGYYPPPCELAAITAAAIAACDAVDGVQDGIVIDESTCDFDPRSVVGQQVVCPDLAGSPTITVTAEAAEVAASTWAGPRDEKTGKSLWYGLGKSASLIPLALNRCDTAAAAASADGGNSSGSINSSGCVPAGFSIPSDYLRLLVSPDKSLDVTTLTWADYTRLFRLSVNKFASVLGTADPDLASFRDRGGKLITWHGLTDELIPPAGTRDYYERVAALDPAGRDGADGAGVDGYYRYFEAPGIMHCFRGEGWYPGDALEALISWVEDGRAPETLYAENTWATAGQPGSRKVELCRYPKRLKYLGGDADLAESWGCEERSA
ncbi:feruloyl esterase [Microdochium nivale]|nr:feruloyl esterase [Microdochium nivale]